MSTDMFQSTRYFVAVTLVCGCGADQALAQGAAQATQPWSLSAGIIESYEDNVSLQTGGGSDLGSRVQAGLGRDWTFHRGSLSTSANASQFFYRESPGLNTVGYGANFGASYLISRRASITVGNTIASSYAQDSAVLTQAGLVLPKVLTRTNVASASWSYVLSPKTQMGLGFRAQTVRFNRSGFDNGSTYAAGFNFSRQIGTVQRFGVSAETQRSLTANVQQFINSVLGTWQLSLGKLSGISAAGGLRPYTLPDGTWRFAPGGSFSFNTHVRQRDAIVLTYDHVVEQAFGFGGTHTSHLASVSYELYVTRKLSLSGSGNYGRGTFPEDRNKKRIGETGVVSVSYAVFQNVNVAGSYRIYSSTEYPAFPTVTNHQTQVSLMYGTKWR